MKRPQADEHAGFYKKYIDTVSENVIAELDHQANSFPSFLKGITSDKASYAYAEGKWTIKELIGHVIDTERIMTYRMLRIARNDNTPLPGFEENDYVDNANANDRTIISLLTELSAVRHSTLLLFKTFTDEQFLRQGTANNNPISVRALGFVIIGHQNHHQRVFQERYL